MRKFYYEMDEEIRKTDTTTRSLYTIYKELLEHPYCSGSDDEKEEWLHGVSALMHHFQFNNNEQEKKIYKKAFELYSDNFEMCGQAYYYLLDSFAFYAEREDDPGDYGITRENLSMILWSPIEWSYGYAIDVLIRQTSSTKTRKYETKEVYDEWRENVKKWYEDYIAMIKSGQ